MKRAIFGPNDHNLNKLGRGPLGDTKHQGEIGLEVSDETIIYVFPI